MKGPIARNTENDTTQGKKMTEKIKWNKLYPCRSQLIKWVLQSQSHSFRSPRAFKTCLLLCTLHKSYVVAIVEFPHVRSATASFKDLVTVHIRTPPTKCRYLSIGSTTVSFGLINSFLGARTPQTKHQNWARVILSAAHACIINKITYQLILTNDYLIIEKMGVHWNIWSPLVLRVQIDLLYTSYARG